MKTHRMERERPPPPWRTTNVTLENMDSLDPKCTELKVKYEACFRSWYSGTYLTANDPSKVTDECASLFQDYRKCLEQVLEDKGILRMLQDQSHQKINSERLS